jgi:hypothetical protein
LLGLSVFLSLLCERPLSVDVSANVLDSRSCVVEGYLKEFLSPFATAVISKTRENLFFGQATIRGSVLEHTLKTARRTSAGVGV